MANFSYYIHSNYTFGSISMVFSIYILLLNLFYSRKTIRTEAFLPLIRICSSYPTISRVLSLSFLFFSRILFWISLLWLNYSPLIRSHHMHYFLIESLENTVQWNSALTLNIIYSPKFVLWYWKLEKKECSFFLIYFLLIDFVFICFTDF